MIAAYGRARWLGFVFDDQQYILINRQVQNGLTLKGIAWAFTSFYAANWHPLTWISHMLDTSLFGHGPAGPHLVNVLLHAVNTVLLFHVLKRMTGALWRSAFVAALFGLHPLHVESVAWISERKDVLSTLFWMLTMLAYVRYVERPSVGRYFLVAAAMAVGLMAKPMLVTLPFALLLLDFWPLGRSVRGAGWKLVVEKLPLFALSAASSVVTYFAQKTGAAMTEFEYLPFGARLANAVVSYVSYLWKTLFPRGLVVPYPYPLGGLPAWQVALASLALLALTILVIRSARVRPYLVTGWLWYLGTLVPVIGLVQVGAQAMADRYTYVPLIGVFIVAAWGIPDAVGRTSDTRRMRALAWAAAAVLALLAVLTWRQVGFWRNNVTLFERTLAFTGENRVAEDNLLPGYRDEGQYRAAIELGESIVRRRPDDLAARYNLAVTYADAGESELAVREYGVLLRRLRAERARTGTKTGRLSAWHLLAAKDRAELLVQLNRPAEAIAELQTLLTEKPDLFDVRVRLAKLLILQGRVREGRRELQRAAADAPAGSPASQEALQGLELTKELPEGVKIPSAPTAAPQ